MKVAETQLRHTAWQRIERCIFLLGIAVLALNLYWWAA
jgi:hypothetical protein